MYNVEYYINYLRNILSHGATSDDFPWSDQALYFLLCNLRAFLTIQKHKKSQVISEFTYQDLPCFEFEYTTIDDCTCTPTDQQCKYRRSVFEVPEILHGRNKLLAYVTDAKGTLISLKSFKDVKYNNNSFLKKDIPQAFIRNRKLYIDNAVDLERATITAVFYDPAELANYDCGTGDACYDPYTQVFPLDKELADTLFKMSYEDILKFSRTQPEDNINDGKGE